MMVQGLSLQPLQVRICVDQEPTGVSAPMGQDAFDCNLLRIILTEKISLWAVLSAEILGEGSWDGLVPQGRIHINRLYSNNQWFESLSRLVLSCKSFDVRSEAGRTLSYQLSEKGAVSFNAIIQQYTSVDAMS